jgi:hypothetical protein
MVFDLRENPLQIPNQEFEASFAEQGRQSSPQTDALIDVTVNLARRARKLKD